MTNAEKLAEVEQLILDFRWARSDDKLPANRTYNALKAIAEDLRGRMGRAPCAAEAEIERRLVAARRSRTDGAMRGLAEELIGKWPVVKQALERFGALEEAKR